MRTVDRRGVILRAVQHEDRRRDRGDRGVGGAHARDELRECAAVGIARVTGVRCAHSADRATSWSRRASARARSSRRAARRAPSTARRARRSPASHSGAASEHTAAISERAGSRARARADRRAIARSRRRRAQRARSASSSRSIAADQSRQVVRASSPGVVPWPGRRGPTAVMPAAAEPLAEVAHLVRRASEAVDQERAEIAAAVEDERGSPIATILRVSHRCLH